MNNISSAGWIWIVHMCMHTTVFLTSGLKCEAMCLQKNQTSGWNFSIKFLTFFYLICFINKSVSPPFSSPISPFSIYPHSHQLLHLHSDKNMGFHKAWYTKLRKDWACLLTLRWVQVIHLLAFLNKYILPIFLKNFLRSIYGYIIFQVLYDLLILFSTCTSICIFSSPSWPGNASCTVINSTFAWIKTENILEKVKTNSVLLLTTIDVGNKLIKIVLPLNQETSYLTTLFHHQELVNLQFGFFTLISYKQLLGLKMTCHSKKQFRKTAWLYKIIITCFLHYQRTQECSSF